MEAPKAVMQKIVARQMESRYENLRLGGRVLLTLACGHVKRMKASQVPPRKTRCLECEAMQSPEQDG